MNPRILRISLYCLSAWFVAARPGAAHATNYYVTTTGNDANNGLTESTGYRTFARAISRAGAGDTIYVGGGTYNLTSGVSIASNKSGTAASPITLAAIAGQSPVLDFKNTPAGTAGIQLSGNYWNVRGLTVQNARDNGIRVAGSHNVLERLSVRNNLDSGVQLSGGSGLAPSYNLIRNVDSYLNYDPANHGEGADGFAAKFRQLGPGNVFDGARAWGNADDGWDFWGAANGVTVRNSWSFKNGNTFNDPAFQGDGAGFKLGHDSGTHVLENVLVWSNRLHGIDINGNAATTPGDTVDAANPVPHGVKVFNVTAYKNGFEANGTANGKRNFNFDENFAHILRNNISLLGGAADTFRSLTVADHNTWNNGFSVSAADFLSFNDTIATGVRLPDGSLPISDFLRLSATSPLVNAGVYVGLPYAGSGPDLGAFEIVPEPAAFAIMAPFLMLILTRRRL